MESARLTRMSHFRRLIGVFQMEGMSHIVTERSTQVFFTRAKETECWNRSTP